MHSSERRFAVIVGFQVFFATALLISGDRRYILIAMVVGRKIKENRLRVVVVAALDCNVLP